MTNFRKAAAVGRAALLACATTVLAGPALATTDTTRSVRIANVTQPTTTGEQRTLRTRVETAAEQACGSDWRSLAEVRYAVRNSDCFAQSVDTAMRELEARWGTSGVSGGGR